jgi:hypothetical protein
LGRSPSRPLLRQASSQSQMVSAATCDRGEPGMRWRRFRPPPHRRRQPPPRSPCGIIPSWIGRWTAELRGQLTPLTPSTSRGWGEAAP